MERRAAFGIAIGGLSAILVAGALDGLPGSINQIHVVLVLVIVIIVAAWIGGRLAGAITAVIATVSFDFFHTQPVRSFSIASSADIVTTALLLVVGLAVGELSTWGQRRAVNAHDEQHEIRRLRRVASLVAGGADSEELIDAVTSELIDCLHLERATYLPSQPDGELPVIDSGGGLDHRHYQYTVDGFALDSSGVTLPVHAGAVAVGAFILEPRADSAVPLDHRIVAAVMADQLGAALASGMRGHHAS